MSNPDTILLPPGSRVVKVLTPPARIPLDATDEPGAVRRASLVLAHLRRIRAEYPDRPMVEVIPSSGCPVFSAVIDLWLAGTVSMIAYRDVATGAEGVAVCLDHVDVVPVAVVGGIN